MFRLSEKETKNYWRKRERESNSDKGMRENARENPEIWKEKGKGELKTERRMREREKDKSKEDYEQEKEKKEEEIEREADLS